MTGLCCFHAEGAENCRFDLMYDDSDGYDVYSLCDTSSRVTRRED